MLKKPYENLKGIESNFDALYGEVSQSQIQRYESLFNKFKITFNCDGAYVASSSGRVEVCGNHTDHNGGSVVSCAISLDTLAMFLPSENGVVHIKSEGYDDIVVDLNAEECEKIGTSSALVRGVAVALKKRGFKVGGFNACFTSNVLGGAGISSSASFEVLIAEIFNFLYNDGIIDCEIKSKVAQFAENVYFGKPCGLLDQTAIAFGGLNKLDFSDVNHIVVNKIENSLSDYTLMLVNTGGSHADLTDEYASIPSEMKQVAKLFGKNRLIEVGEQVFYDGLPKIYDKVCDRAILRTVHFFEENNRVDKVCEALRLNDYETFLSMINQSGDSSLWQLQNCYVSNSTVQSIPKALSVLKRCLANCACRVHGGGFAGCVLCVVDNNKKEKFLRYAHSLYGDKNVIQLRVRSVGTIVL